MFPTQVAEWQTRGARRLAADRDGLVVRRRRQSDRARICVRSAALARCESGALDRRARRARRAAGRARGEPDRPGRAARVSRRLQRGRGSGARLRPDGNAVRAVGRRCSAALQAATSGADGRVTVTVPALTAILLRAGADLPKRSVTKVTLKIRRDEISSLLRALGDGVDARSACRHVRGQARRARRSGAGSAWTTRRRTPSTSTRAGSGRASKSRSWP